MSFNANLSEAFLSNRKKPAVALVALGATGVAIYDALLRSSSRMALHTAGLLMSLDVEPPLRKDADVVCIDIVAVWHDAKEANVLLQTFLRLDTVLKAGGRAFLAVMMPPKGHRSLVARALSLWSSAFASVEVRPQVQSKKNTEFQYDVYLDGFTTVSDAHMREARSIRDALLDCTDLSIHASLPPPFLAKVNLPRARPGLAVRRAIGTLPVSFRDIQLVHDFDDEIYLNKKKKNGHVGRYAYVESARDFEPRCHWGQLKLLLSEWDFLNRTRDIWSTRETVVIYAGAADGAHTPLLVSLFPEIRRWFLFDGARFAPNVLACEKISAYSGTRGFVTDATVPKFLELARGRAILFISDIRLDPTEADVLDDMVSQARWGAAMGADALLLKFRPPYPITSGSNKKKKTSVPSPVMEDFSSALLDNSASIMKQANTTVSKELRFLYLDGVVQQQLFPPMNSTETRLYVRPAIVNGTKMYPLTTYDVLQHEEENYFYNISTRRLSMPSAPPVDMYLPGFDRGYESIAALRIAEAYASYAAAEDIETEEKDNNKNQNSNNNIHGVTRVAVRILAKMLLDLREVTRVDLTHCVSRTLSKYIRKAKHGNLPDYQMRRLHLWKRLVDRQEEEMVAIQRRRIGTNTLFSRESTERLMETLLPSTHA